MLHGMVLAAAPCSGSRRPGRIVTVRAADAATATTDAQARRLGWLLAGVAAALWLTILGGTYVSFPPYRAPPPAGATDLAAHPRALLLSDPGTAWLHAFAMEVKEHVPWIAAMLATAVAFVGVREPRRLLSDPPLRRMTTTLLATCFAIVSFVSLLGVLVNKVAPLSDEEEPYPSTKGAARAGRHRGERRASPLPAARLARDGAVVVLNDIGLRRAGFYSPPRRVGTHPIALRLARGVGGAARRGAPALAARGRARALARSRSYRAVPAPVGRALPHAFGALAADRVAGRPDRARTWPAIEPAGRSPARAAGARAAASGADTSDKGTLSTYTVGSS